MNNTITYIPEDKTYIFDCPHCDNIVQVHQDQVNCHIFRHGIFKSTGLQIDPHLPKDDCEKLFSNDLIYGCGKPFRLLRNANNDISHVSICDYI